jgi:hypothetical protein
MFLSTGCKVARSSQVPDVHWLARLKIGYHLDTHTKPL